MRSSPAWREGIAALAACVVAILTIEIALAALDAPARRALSIFAVAVVCWAMTPLDDVFIALVAAMAMALLVAGSPNSLFMALGDNLVWLLVAAFIFAEAFRASGLAELLARKVLTSVRTLRGLFHGLTAVILASAFVVPSTSGRAAVLLPVFAGIAATLPSERARVALALLFPTGILLGAFGSLVGAARMSRRSRSSSS